MAFDERARNLIRDMTVTAGKIAVDSVKLEPATLRNQLLRSSAAIAALYAEACSAESRRDFVHKCGIAEKEATETWMWLIYLQQVDPENTAVADRIREVEGYRRFLAASRHTARSRRSEEGGASSLPAC